MSIIICVILALFLLYLFLVCPSLRRHGDRILMKGMYVAHRGLHDAQLGAPENSVNAFLLAKKLGYCIETDIHLTRDGQVVVFHDNTTGRMCEKDLSVESSTLAELKELRLNGTDQKILT
ncbi:MAG: glycerophosphodiester phosphodiesterase, partial [Clostridia bacterium]|nr:glycerophosphodiester phosphodiesterase [Clostridia bacterium]